uniref:Uncharacterized protein n=1 Tax=Chromera velia CCMP2878 TaxID=1169474 RepID=A0A0G4IF66_9ALVE
MEQQDFYREQMEHLQRLYEERVQSLTDRVRQIYRELQTDEALQALREDPNSQAFVPDRMQEVVESNLAAEREAQIQTLMKRVAFLEARDSQLATTRTEQQQTATEVISAQAEALEYKRRYEASVAERRQVAEQLDECASREKDLELRLKEAEKSLGEANESKGSLEVEYKHVERYLEEEGREASETIRLLVGKVKDAKKKLELQKKHRATLEASLQRLKDQVTELEKAKKGRAALQGRLALVEAQATSQLRGSISLEKHQQVLNERMEQADASHRQSLRSLEEKFQYEVREKVRAAEERKRTEFAGALQQIRRGVQALEESRGVAWKEREALRARLQQAEQNNAEIATSRKALASSLEETAENLRATRTLAEEERKKRTDVEARLRDTELEFCTQVQQVQSQTAEAAAAKHTVEIERLSAETAAVRSDCDRLGGENAILREKADDLSERLDASLAECDRLRARLEDAANEQRDTSSELRVLGQRHRRMADALQRLRTVARAQIEALGREASYVRLHVESEVQTLMANTGLVLQRAVTLQQERQRQSEGTMAQEHARLREELQEVKDTCREALAEVEGAVQFRTHIDKLLGILSSGLRMDEGLRTRIVSPSAAAVPLSIQAAGHFTQGAGRAKGGTSEWTGADVSIWKAAPRLAGFAAPATERHHDFPQLMKDFQTFLEHAVERIGCEAVAPVSAQAEREASDLRRKLSDLQGQLTKSMKDMEEIGEENVALEKKAMTTKKEADLLVDMTRQEAEQQVRRQLRTMQTALEELQTHAEHEAQARELHVLKQADNKMKTVVAEKDKMIQEAEKQTEKARQRMQEMAEKTKAQVESAERRNNDLRDQLKGLQGEVESLRQARRKLVSQVEDLTRQRKGAEEAAVRRETQLSELQRARERDVQAAQDATKKALAAREKLRDRQRLEDERLQQLLQSTQSRPGGDVLRESDTLLAASDRLSTRVKSIISLSPQSRQGDGTTGLGVSSGDRPTSPVSAVGGGGGATLSRSPTRSLLGVGGGGGSVGGRKSMLLQRSSSRLDVSPGRGAVGAAAALGATRRSTTAISPPGVASLRSPSALSNR